MQSCSRLLCSYSILLICNHFWCQECWTEVWQGGLQYVCIYRYVSYVYMHTENVYHRMLGVGRDLCGSSSPPPLPKQGQLQQAAQDLVQAGFEYLQRRRLHSSSVWACSSAPSPSEGRSSSSCSDGTSYASVCEANDCMHSYWKTITQEKLPHVKKAYLIIHLKIRCFLCPEFSRDITLITRVIFTH